MKRKAWSPGRSGATGSTLPIGKVPVDLLRHLLARFAKSRDPCVVVGAGIGLDAAAIRIGSKVLVAKTDPITFVADEIGTYALLINANDLAAAGATPKWFLATLVGQISRRMTPLSTLESGTFLFGTRLVVVMLHQR